MTAGWFPKGAEAVLNKQVDFNTDTIKAALLASTYVYSSAHDFYNDISASVVGTPQTIGSPTIASGTFDGADVNNAALTGAEVGFIAIYQDTGDAATSILLFLIDDYAGLPFTPDGSDIPIIWPTTGIMRPTLYTP